MGRTFSEKKLVIASHNQGKLREIRDLIGPLGIEVVSAGELGLPEPEETGSTYIANAELKARASAEGSGRPPSWASTSACNSSSCGARK